MQKGTIFFTVLITAGVSTFITALLISLGNYLNDKEKRISILESKLRVMEKVITERS